MRRAIPPPGRTRTKIRSKRHRSRGRGVRRRPGHPGGGGLRGTDRLRAASNSLAAKIIQLTMPGVPDVYQGTEFWDRSLTDPDNRRPVDFAQRVKELAAIDAGTLPAAGTRSQQAAGDVPRAAASPRPARTLPGLQPADRVRRGGAASAGVPPRRRGRARRPDPRHPAPLGTGARRRVAGHRRRTPHRDEGRAHRRQLRAGTVSVAASWVPTRWLCWYRWMEKTHDPGQCRIRTVRCLGAGRRLRWSCSPTGSSTR